MANNIEGGIAGLVNMNFISPLARDKRMINISGHMMDYQLADDIPGADGSGAINTVLSNFGQVVKINSMTSNFRDRSNQKLRIFFSIKNLTGSSIVFVPVGDMTLQLWVNYFDSAGTLISGVGSPTLTWNETPAGLTVANGGAANFDVTVDNTSNFASPPAGAVSFSLTFRGQNLDTANVWNTYFGYGMNGQYGPITSFAATPY